MLTVKQPPTYGYKSVHDLPTPPSTSRPSPPLINQESIPKLLPGSYRSHSPPNQPMSAPHRGLPPPAAMTLPPQQPPSTGIPPPAHHAPPPPPPPPSLGSGHQHRDGWGQLPAPPQQWQGAEESMRHWLQARAEEDKRRQEEERTRQESLRLEQRKVEMDMLRTSLSGGIPPAMVPLVFAGMGGGGALSQTAVEWMQQFLPPSQAPRAQIMPPQGTVSPEHQREAPPPASIQYHSLPPSAAPPPGYAYPGSPGRPRGQTVGATVGRPVMNLPSLNTNVHHAAGAHGQAPAMAPHQHLQQPQMPPPQESQASPSIYFHHWQPPTTQASSSSNRPGSPSGETPRKRKATGQHQAAPSPPRGELRHRSPPPSYPPSTQSNRGRFRHARQRSDLSPYRSSGPGRARRESFGGPIRRMSPIRSSTPAPRPGSRSEVLSEYGASERGETQKPSVSSMLSEEPRPPSQQSAPAHGPEEGEHRRQTSPPAESRSHVGGEGMAPSREGAGEGEGA